MKRVAAVLVLVTALTLLAKLAFKRPATPGEGPTSVGFENLGAEIESRSELDRLLEKYPENGNLVRQVVEKYRRTATEIEAKEGLRGLKLLDRLDLEAIFLFERHPEEFARLAGAVGDDAAADLLTHWAGYFGLKRADDLDRAVLIGEVARLSKSARRVAGHYPQALPLILAEPSGVCELIRRLESDPKSLNDALAMLDFVSLDEGPSSLQTALSTLEQRRELALDAFRMFGPEGFALVGLYGEVLAAIGPSTALDDALIALRVNSDDLDVLLGSRTPESIARLIDHATAVGLLADLGGSPHALRLLAEHGEAGDLALKKAGADAADIVFEDYDESVLRDRAVVAIGEHGMTAAALLSKYATDPDFRAILREHGSAIVPPIAQADFAPEALLALQQKSKRTWTETFAKQILAISGDSGQSTIRLIRKDGLARASELSESELRFYMFLPLYDIVHLAGVVGRGHAPTTGEMTWALVDGLFVAFDLASLSALQPEGAAATEAARSQLKATAKGAAVGLAGEAAEAAGPILARRGADTASDLAGRAARWWAVRAAGGTYAMLKKLPKALAGLSLPQVAASAGPLCRKAGIKLATWSPIRLIRGGKAVILRIPPGRWGKYVGLNVAQAGVGIVAMHKMEEYLSSRRPPSDSP